MAVTHLSDGFLPGSTIVLKGCVEDNAHRFVINLQCGPVVPHEVVSDIALHISTRFDELVIVRNSCMNGFWGCEDRDGDLLFQKGRAFVIQINCERRGFKITVDDYPFIYFKHRLEVATITHVSVHGDVSLLLLDYVPSQAPGTFSPMFPPGCLPVPFKGLLTNGFLPGAVLTLKGKIKTLVDRFCVNLVCKTRQPITPSSVTDIALHFNARFDKTVITRNSLIYHEWGEEEVEGKFIFAANDHFIVVIQCEKDMFKIYVNDSLYTSYKHRINPINISYVYIYGGIELYQVSE